MRNKWIKKRKNRLGYTLSELLLVIAILIVLFALAIPGLMSLQKALRQKELDTKAETIYTALQSKLSELYSNGNGKTYDPESYEDFFALDGVPQDYYSEISGDILDGDLNKVYYFYSGSDAAQAILGDDTLSEVITGEFVAEIIPYATRVSDSDEKQISAGLVYAVYYSEGHIGDNDQDVTNSEQYGDGTNDSYLNSYRVKKNRKDITNARVGYYGGSDPGSSNNTSTLSITDMEITSDEEANTAIVKARKSIAVTSDVVFTFTLEDTYGNKRDITYEEKTGKVLVNGTSATKEQIGLDINVIGVNYIFTFTLDDLSSSTTRFDALYGEQSVKDHAGYDSGEYKDKTALVAGSHIKMTAKMECPDDNTVAPDSKSRYGNSIYDYGAEDTDESVFTSEKTVTQAKITTARHLQNLDESSNVDDRITTATILNDISFKDYSDFYSDYNSNYFNKTTTITKINSTGSTSKTTVPNFKPIENDNLTSITGLKVDEDTKEESNYVIYNLVSSSSTNSGLFASVNKELKISNITMLGTKINSTDASAGAFVGLNNGKLNIENSYVYLSTTNDDIPSAILSEYNLESIRWIQGKNVGGLVGNNTSTLTIVSSSASSVIGNAGSTTGGLVGMNSGNLSIQKSYADSYLYGKSVAGLVGSNNKGDVSISTSYAAGFIASDADDDAIGAGLVNGTIANAENVYTIVNFNNVDRNNGITKNTDEERKGTFYSTATAITKGASTVYRSNSIKDVDGTKDIDSLKSAPDGFTLTGSRNITPYRLMGQSLPTYAYPTIIGLDHYGDWDVSFMAGSLVYYEEYDNGKSYGFDGAGVDISVSTSGVITGDGYGIIYKSEPEKDVKYKIGSTEVTIDKSTVKEFDVNGEHYYLYPLNMSDNNPTSVNDSYWTRIEIEGSDESKYYDFNPHFARSYVEVNQGASTSAKPTSISIRSPRHLYNLSLYYDSYYHSVLGSNVVYTQERNLDYSKYSWSSYYNESTSTVSSQAPIGQNESTSFNARYNGSCYEIGNVSFISQSGSFVGMFGHSTGTLQNIVIATQYSKDGNNYNVKREDYIGRNEYLYIGILAGYNNGTINNCAVAGYYLSGIDATIRGYEGATLYIGGLVGYNDEKGSITKSSADSPQLSLNMYRSTCYAGGLVGVNEGTINNAYALNHISSTVRGGTTVISGFAGSNSGRVYNSYCATALTSSGDGSYSYLFAPQGGIVNSSYYLYKGSYQFVENLYSYNGDVTTTSATYKTYNELIDLANTKASKSLYHGLTKETRYPYRAIVTDADGNYVHYGEWQVSPTVGTYGVFYWEHETEGQNNGYKLTYVGREGETYTYDTTLCQEHDDGGVITEYGYGYYVIEGSDADVQVSSENVTFSTIDTNAQAALQEQFPGLTFYPYTTSTDNLYLTGSDINGTVKIKYKDDDPDTFYISPFFGNALSMKVDSTSSISSKAKPFFTTSTSYGRSALTNEGVPGSSTNQYEIRSAAQLQYINWNSSNTSATNLVTTSNYKNFNYLMSTSSTGTASQTLNNAGNRANTNLHFIQSHDLNAENITNFTPIAGQTTSSNGSNYNAVLYSWFGSSFDGQSYKIQELNIDSKSYTVGLFGVTVDANIKNVILYSSNPTKAVIQRNTSSNDADGAYALGGLIGIAYNYNGNSSSSNIIENCAIAGYRIVDNSKNKQTLGEANVGGLIGVANVNVDRCSAVVDIELNCEHQNNGNYTVARWGNFIRVGGIAGAVQDSITNSYSGGSIQVTNENLLNETYASGTTNYNSYISSTSTSTANTNNSTHIYIAGIAGSGFTMNYQNFTNSSNIKDGNPYVQNCYTYMDFPDLEGTIRAITMITSVADRYAQGPTATINNCYYLEDSADFDYSNAPSYKFQDRGFSAQNAISAGLIPDMIKGSAKWMYKVLNGSSNGQDRLSSVTLTAKSYNELTSDDMITSLGSSFHRISTQDSSGTTVDGKYSFPAGESALTGKNYPFPTVIQQSEDSITYNLHYGRWPVDTAYFEDASSTIDIFNDMDMNDNVAYKEIVLNKNGKDINEGKLEFAIQLNDKDDTSIAEIVEQDGKQYRIDENGNYVVKVKANTTGTVDIIATYYQNDSAATPYNVYGTITVTADLIASAKENEFTLASGEKDTSTLSALSSDGTKDFSKNTNLKWTATSSNVGDTDTPAVTLPNNISSNTLSLTGTGYNGVVTVKATYTYQGVTYEANTYINVYAPSVIGLAGKSDQSKYTYNEAGLSNKTDETIYGSDRTTSYVSGAGPLNTNDFYLYIENDETGLLAKALENEKITIEATDKNGDAIDSILSTSVNSEDDNGYTTLDFSLNIKSSISTEPISGNTIKVTIEDEDSGNTYIFELDNVTLNPIPYSIVLDANGGAFTDGDKTKTLERIEENNDPSLYPQPVRKGYDFDGWFVGTVKQDSTIPMKDEDITLNAGWSALTKTVKVENNLNKTLSTNTLTLTYDQNADTSTLSNVDDYLLDKIYIDANHTTEFDPTDSNQINDLVLAENPTLYAVYLQNYTVNFVTTYEDGTTKTFGQTALNEKSSGNVSINLGTYNTDYELVGWYSSSDANTASEVVSKDGVINSDNLKTFLNSSTGDAVNLYAKWRHKESYEGYFEVQPSEVSTSDETDIILVTTIANEIYALRGNDSSIVGIEEVAIQTTQDENQYNYVEVNEANKAIVWTYNYEKKLKLYNKTVSRYLRRNYNSIELHATQTTDWNINNNGKIQSNTTFTSYYIRYTNSQGVNLTTNSSNALTFRFFTKQTKEGMIETFVYSDSDTTQSNDQNVMDSPDTSDTNTASDANKEETQATSEPTSTPASTASAEATATPEAVETPEPTSTPSDSEEDAANTTEEETTE